MLIGTDNQDPIPAIPGHQLGCRQGLFKGVVQRFEERVSVDSLKNVIFTSEIRDEILDSFYQCCRYMEGHSHSDKYAYKKPTLQELNEEIQRFNAVKKKISDLGKS